MCKRKIGGILVGRCREAPEGHTERNNGMKQAQSNLYLAIKCVLVMLRGVLFWFGDFVTGLPFEPSLDCG